MSIKFYSKDLPAARAYVANQLSTYGYEAEANIVRKDTGFHLDAGRFMRSGIAGAAARLSVLWTRVTAAKASAQHVSVDTTL